MFFFCFFLGYPHISRRPYCGLVCFFTAARNVVPLGLFFGMQFFFSHLSWFKNDDESEVQNAVGNAD